MEAYRDSLGILGTPRLNELEGLPSIVIPRKREIDEKDFLSGRSTGFTDTLGILGPPTGPAEGLSRPKQEEPQGIKDSLGIFAPTAQKQMAPEEVEAKTAEAEIQKRLNAYTRSQWIESQRELGVSDEAIQKMLGGVQHPWVDPLEVGAAGYGFGAKFALSRGAKLGQAALRGFATGAPGVVTEYPLGAFIDSFAEGNEALALLAAIGLGLISGMTVERLAERGLLKAAQNIAQKHPAKARQVLPPEVLERFKVKPTAEVEAPQNVLDVQEARLARRRAQASARQAPIEPESPFTRSGGMVEDVITTPASQAKGYRDSLNILTPRKESAVVWGGQTTESAREAAVIAARETAAKRAAQAAEAPNFRTWVSLTGGVNPKDPSWGGELRDLARGVGKGGKTVSKVPPGFYNTQARGLDERVTDAVDAGWLRRGASDQDFFDLLELNPTKRLAQVDDVSDIVKAEEAFLSKAQESLIVSPKQMLKGQELVDVDVQIFDDAWKRNKPFYVGEGGEGEIAGRRKGVQDWLAAGKQIEAPTIAVDKHGDVIFSDGRHRFAYLRDLGHEQIPVVMDQASIANARKAGMLTEPGMDRVMWMHPSTITGPLGGLAAGVDWEALKEGEVKVDPKKALIGALAGAAGGAAIPKARKLASNIANTWETKFAEPFLDKARAAVNGLIVHEEIRRWFSMGRSKAFNKVMRDYKRETEELWASALEIGEELQKLAPTKVEQKRLMQIIKGSVTANAEMASKAKQVQGLFQELRDNLKEHHLLEYSRFDKLTRKERTKLRKIAAMPDPATVDDYNKLTIMAHNLGLTPPQGTYSKTDFIKDAQAELKFYRDRLNDYYHFASAREYAPIYYTRHEGLSPEARKVLMDEIQTLKIRSRRGNPEGKQELEHLIGQLEKMLGSGFEARKQARATYRGLVKGYAHKRMEIPIEVQRIMGLIEEAPFPVAKGAGVQMTDIRKAQLFKYIADEPAWTIKPRKGLEIPSNYHLIEDERFGALNGRYIRKDIWGDLKEVEEWRSFFVQNWDKYLGWWKYGKVVLNPATHMRNTYSNLILAYLGDVNPTDIKTYAAAAKAMKGGAKNPHYKEAKDWGLFNTTFYSAEIGKLRNELDAVRNPGQAKNFIRNIMSAPADLYQGNEKLFKMAVFIKAREGGMSVDEAARKAEKFLFNYGDIPPFVKGMKRWVSPFFTFTYKAVPLFAEMSIRKPWKVGAIMASMYAMEEYSKHKLGLSDEDAAEERALLPEWQRQKVGPYVHVLMPFRDKYGSNLYLDMAYILPYGTIGEKWGQSAIPLDDMLLNNPLFQMSAAILTNTQPFTGRKIYDDVLDSTARVTAKYLEYAWRDIAPSMAPGGYGWNKVKTGLMNTLTDEKVLDWADRPIELQTAILSSLLGIKLSPANTEKLKQFELMERRKISRKVHNEIGRLKREKDRNVISEDKFREEMDRLIDLRKRLLMERPGQ